MTHGAAPGDLARAILDGDRRALARAITYVESGHERAATILRSLYPRAGRAVAIGVTGFPGAGKSSLVDRMIELWRGQGKRVGVIAVDPSSAFSGGAILGDRVRMMRHAGDSGVFIRSMATRGHLGGLSRAAGEVLDLLDAAGYDVVVIETVGVGQSEIDVARLADVTLVVLVPGMGDDIQAIKAGILEIADLFVINKADRDGADKLASELQQMMALTDDGRPRPAIVRTVATRGQGIDELAAAIEEHLARPETAGARRERRVQRARVRLEEVLAQALFRRVVERGVGLAHWNGVVERLARRETDPYSAVEEILAADRR
jgi:LAO/AO transport system kinase